MKIAEHIASIKEIVEKAETLESRLDTVDSLMPEPGVISAKGIGLSYGGLPHIDEEVFYNFSGVDVEINYMFPSEPTFKLGIHLRRSANEAGEAPKSYLTITESGIDGAESVGELSTAKKDFIERYIARTHRGGDLRMVCLPDRMYGRIQEGRKVVEWGERVLEFQNSASSLSLEEKWEYVVDVLRVVFDRGIPYTRENLTGMLEDSLEDLNARQHILQKEYTIAQREAEAVNIAGLSHSEITFFEHYAHPFEVVVQNANGLAYGNSLSLDTITFDKMIGNMETLSEVATRTMVTRHMSEDRNELCTLSQGVHRFAQRNNPGQVYVRLGRISQILKNRFAKNGENEFSKEFGNYEKRFYTIADKILE